MSPACAIAAFATMRRLHPAFDMCLASVVTSPSDRLRGVRAEVGFRFRLSMFTAGEIDGFHVFLPFTRSTYFMPTA